MSLKKLRVSFGGTVALDEVDLTVRSGEAVAVAGPNGSGKTSLLNAISGLVRSEGEVELYGRNITRLPSWLRARLGLVRTFQFAKRFGGLDSEEILWQHLPAGNELQSFY
jgi:branched-chain amino acid transport system ATP-binding protein